MAWAILVKYNGTWGVWREFATETDARSAVRYWRERLSWQLQVAYVPSSTP